MSRDPDTDPMTPLDSNAGDSYDASSSRANTDERVIGSLLDGLDAPQPLVRSRSGRRADGRDDGPIDIRAPGDRNAPTALLPHAVSRQQKRTLIALGVAALFLVAAAVLLVTGSKPSDSPTAVTSPIVPMSISSNHQMPPVAPTVAAVATGATVTAVPTLAVSSLPTAATAAIATAPAPVPATAGTGAEHPRPNGHPSTPSPGQPGQTGGNHPEIKEDPL